jgi:antitoxin (DNA-binding transcriptional repressor) of toxin-antitoxin stability system
MIQKGAEEARNQLPHLLEAAEGGRSTVITGVDIPSLRSCRSATISRPSCTSC